MGILVRIILADVSSSGGMEPDMRHSCHILRKKLLIAFDQAAFGCLVTIALAILLWVVNRREWGFRRGQAKIRT